MYRSDLPHFILDFPWRKFRSRTRVHRFAIISRRQSATILRKSYGIHSAAHLRRKKQPRPFFSMATFASNTLAFFRYRRGLITQDRCNESRSRLFKLAYRNICNGITIIRINRKHRVDLIDLYGSRL